MPKSSASKQSTVWGSLRVDWHQRFIPGELGVTGVVSADGHLLAVNAGTLTAKVRRAFFSHLEYLALPEGNLEQAKLELVALQERYPRRNLKLVAAQTLADLLEDRNVIRPEKVCPAQYVARVAHKYTRTTYIQVSLLLIVTYVLVSLIYPTLWIGFDNDISDLVIEPTKIVLRNAGGYELRTITPTGDFNERVLLDSTTWKYFYVVRDFDQDGDPELVLSPPYDRLPPRLQMYESNGELVWERLIVGETSYPGDVVSRLTPQNLVYTWASIRNLSIDDSMSIIVTSISASDPGRTQLRAWNTGGFPLCDPYIFPGFCGFGSRPTVDFNEDGVQDLVCTGTNNRYPGAGIIVLNPCSFEGASPPYDEETFLMSSMRRGTQLVYVHLPESPLSHWQDTRNSVDNLYLAGGKSWCCIVRDGTGLTYDSKPVERKDLPRFLFYFDNQFIPTNVTINDGSAHVYNKLAHEATGGPGCLDSLAA